MTSLGDKFGNYTSRVLDLLEKKIFLEFLVFLNFTFFANLDYFGNKLKYLKYIDNFKVIIQL